jgi:hypothetical protein
MYLLESINGASGAPVYTILFLAVNFFRHEDDCVSVRAS